MTYVELRSMGAESHGCPARPSERLGRYLRHQYRGAHQIKSLARDMGATPKAAENALKGHWPNDLHFAAIVRRFGRDLLDAVFAPEIEPVLAKLNEEERQLEEALEAVRKRRRQAAGRPQGAPQPVAPPEARSFTRRAG